MISHWIRLLEIATWFFTNHVSMQDCGSNIVRQSWSAMSLSDQESFADALGQIHASDLFPSYVDDHANPEIVSHNTGRFLQDHRTFLIRLEDDLFQHGWTGGVPYYDASIAGDNGHDIFHDTNLWDLLGGSNIDCLAAPFDSPVISDGEGGRFCAFRDLIQSNTLWDTECLRCIMTNVLDESIFSSTINAGIHAQVHQAVGGSMAMTNTSAGDPFFYLHHAYIDMLWASWQRLNGYGDHPTAEDCYQYDTYYEPLDQSSSNVEDTEAFVEQHGSYDPLHADDVQDLGLAESDIEAANDVAIRALRGETIDGY